MKFTKKYQLRSIISSRYNTTNQLHGVICNSIVNTITSNAKLSLLEHSIILSSLTIGSRCVVSHLMINNTVPLDIKDGSMIQQIPLKGLHDVYVYVLFYINDDIKVHYQDNKATIFSLRWNDFFAITTTSANDIWDTNMTDKSLWTAKLFPICNNTNMINLSLWMQDLNTYKDTYKDMSVINQWKETKRVSMMELMNLGDASAMHLYQRFLSVVVKSKYSHANDTLLDTYNYCKQFIYYIKQRFGNMLNAVTVAMLLCCCRVLTNDYVNEKLASMIHYVVEQFDTTSSNDEILLYINEIINYFNDIWIIISKTTITSRIVLEYFDSLLDNKCKVLVAQGLLYYGESYIQKELQARVVFMIGWILRNNNLNFESSKLSQVSEAGVFSMIKNKLVQESQANGDGDCFIETLAQRIVYCQIQASLDTKCLTFNRDNEKTSLKNVVLATAPVRIGI